MVKTQSEEQSVLLIVDAQVGVMNGAWNSSAVLSNIAEVVASSRLNHVPVIWVQHADDELVQGSAEWQIVPELSPLAGEPIVVKQFNSAFEGTSLDKTLAQYNATHVVLAGAATNWCIRATAHGVLERGYDLTLVMDAHTTKDLDKGDGTSMLACDIVYELNAAMQWLEYPDRRNNIAPANEVEFKRSGRLLELETDRN